MPFDWFCYYDNWGVNYCTLWLVNLIILIFFFELGVIFQDVKALIGVFEDSSSVVKSFFGRPNIDICQ